MAVVIFSGDQVVEAKALISVLTLWLREMEDRPPRAARARFVYGSNGVARLIIEIEPVDEPK